MKITLIGMSNVGKTYWSKKLENSGYFRFSCDEYIEKELEKELRENEYYGIADIARWMGQPYESRYKYTSNKYLSVEKTVVSNIIGQLRFNVFKHENIVIDTTGSVIYCGSAIMKALRVLTTIVYLDIPKSVQQEMYKSYLYNPKPVYWGNSFQINGEKSPQEALVKCYPRLLEYRKRHYQKYAHLSLNYYLLRSRDFDLDNLLYILQDKKEKLI